MKIVDLKALYKKIKSLEMSKLFLTYRKYCLILFVKQDTFERAICEIVS